MAGLTFHLLGPLWLESEAGCGVLPQSLKARELLSYLLLHHDRPVFRSALAELLWPDCDPAQGLKQLRQALWHLQNACGHGDAEQHRLQLDISSRSLTLHSVDRCRIDVVEFEDAFALVRGPVSRPLDAEIAAIADRAIGLYRGHLLEGFDFDWCIVEREWLRSAYLTMLDRLMAYAEHHGEFELGIDYGERILRIDRAREYTHRRMMVLHALLGNRTGALRQYDRCVAALADELDVLPARSTQSLRDRVRSGAEISATVSAGEPEMSEAVRDGTAAAIARLSRIQRAIGELQALLQSELYGLDTETRTR